jgi:hypothetical protein
VKISSNDQTITVVFDDGGVLHINLEHAIDPLTECLATLAALGKIGFDYQSPTGRNFSNSAHVEPHEPVSFETRLMELT